MKTRTKLATGDMQFITEPAPHHLAEVKGWLEKEETDSGRSFICNWGCIEESFHERQFLCVVSKNQTIAFLTHGRLSHVVSAEIAVVRPDKRRKGVGAWLMDKVENYLQSNGCLVAYGECAPSSSKPFWLRREYRPFPPEHSMNQSTNVHIYKVLVNNQPAETCSGPTVQVDLWHAAVGSLGATGAPHVTVAARIADTHSSRLSPPVILPAEPDWKIRVTHNNKSREGRVKDLTPRAQRHNQFLLLTDLDLTVT
jgi:GNAT superfamily N-acetyltransferase